MKEILVDMVRQVAPLFEAVRVTGSDTGTKVEAYTEDKSLFLMANFKTVIPELAGEFGISDLTMLKGLLDFPSYKTDDAKFTVVRDKRDGLEFVSQFHFKDSRGAETKFKTIHPKMVGDPATIKNIDWELFLTPSKAKIEEISKLSGLLADVEKTFGLKVENDTLFLTLGGDSEARHSATVALSDDEDIDGKLDADLINSNPWFFATAHLLMILKNAGNAKSSVQFSSRGVIGVIGVTVETDKGEYTYYLRGKPEA